MNPPFFYDNINKRLIDGLRETIERGDRVSVAGSAFSVYAFEALRKELGGVGAFRFLYTSPAFSRIDTSGAKKASKEFFIPERSREDALFGTPFEIRLRNRLMQQAAARACAAWIRSSGTFKACRREGAMPGEILVGDGERAVQFFPVKDLTTTSLGTEKGEAYATQVLRLDAPVASEALKQFDAVWTDASKTEDVTARVLENMETLYRENAPEFIYYVILSNIFSRLFDEGETDTLPNEGTGFRKSAVWQKLYGFQRDAATGIIRKLEKYNGCILADSVGLGKTFTALAVIKYYESRNQRVLVLCPKKLNENWMTWRSNYRTNVLAEDRFRYEVLFHSDLSRRKGFSNGVDLALVNWGNYDLVVIDESHNFRNGYSTDADFENRYERLMKSVIREGVRTKVLMLSATPVNNRFSDLRNQLQLACEGDSSVMDERLGLKGGIDELFRRAQQAYNVWAKLPAAERTANALQAALPFEFFDLLDAVTIARSRRHVERYYDTSEIGKFPKRLAPVSRRPRLTDAPGAPDYREIFESIRELDLAVYTPSSFVLPSRAWKYEDLGGTRGLSLSGRELGIRRLMSVNLLKRLESSVNSFRLTLERVAEQIRETLAHIERHDALVGKSVRVADGDFDFDAEDADAIGDLAFVTSKNLTIELADIDTVQWFDYLTRDLKRIDRLLDRIRTIEPARDGKLLRLKADLAEKIANPINRGNRKVLVFTAFADTAEYLYEHIAPFMQRAYGIHTALVTGQTVRCTLETEKKPDFNTALTLFSPVSKEKATVAPEIDGEVDVLIATDCISEGQNLQDCDCLINFDIHWNPVRIIQRFGRIDRIGSRNDVIKLVNYWPDMELDEYIDLKSRVEARMKASVLASTGDDDPLSTEARNELHYREEQLKRLQHEILDLEDVGSGVSITDLGLNTFQADLLAYAKSHPELSRAPHGLHAVVRTDEENPEGAIFVLRDIREGSPVDARNRIHPYYMVYVGRDGEVVLGHTNPKALLDRLRFLAKGRIEPDAKLCARFNEETHDGRRMERYSELLDCAVAAIGIGREAVGLDAFFEGDDDPVLAPESRTLNDFELVAFFVVRGDA